jgi:hypothetical protein
MAQKPTLSAEDNKMVEVAITAMKELRESRPMLVPLSGGKNAALIAYRYGYGKFDVVVIEPRFVAYDYPGLECGSLSPHTLEMNPLRTVYTPPDEETTTEVFLSDPKSFHWLLMDTVFWKTLRTVSNAKLSTDEIR